MMKTLEAVLKLSEKDNGKSLYTGNASCQPPRKKVKQPLSHSKPMTTSLQTYRCWDDEAFVETVFKLSEKDKGKALFTGIASCPPPRKAADPLSHSKPMTSLETLDGNHKPESSMADDRHKKSWADIWDQDFLHGVIKVYLGDYQDVIKVKCSLDDDADDGLNTGNTLRPGPGKAEPLSQFKATGSLKTPAGNHNQGSVANAGTSGCAI